MSWRPQELTEPQDMPLLSRQSADFGRSRSLQRVVGQHRRQRIVDMQLDQVPISDVHQRPRHDGEPLDWPDLRADGTCDQRRGIRQVVHQTGQKHRRLIDNSEQLVHVLCQPQGPLPQRAVGGVDGHQR